MGELGGGQIFAHFIGNIKISSFIYELKLWHDVADAKNRENYIYEVVQYQLYTI